MERRNRVEPFFYLGKSRIDSNERTPERGPVGGGKKIRCLSEKDTMEGVLKNERKVVGKFWNRRGSGMQDGAKRAGAGC